MKTGEELATNSTQQKEEETKGPSLRMEVRPSAFAQPGTILFCLLLFGIGLLAVIEPIDQLDIVRNNVSQQALTLIQEWRLTAGVGILAFSLLWFSFRMYFLKRTRYTVMDDVILWKHGILAQEDNIVLYKVQDVRLRRSFKDWLFGIGTIEVYSSDVTEGGRGPFRMAGIPKVHQTYSLLRGRWEEILKRRGIVAM